MLSSARAGNRCLVMDLRPREGSVGADRAGGRRHGQDAGLLARATVFSAACLCSVVAMSLPAWLAVAAALLASGISPLDGLAACPANHVGAATRPCCGDLRSNSNFR